MPLGRRRPVPGVPDPTEGLSWITLVTEDVSDAVVVLVVVLVVQQLEGNVLQPLIMERAVRLHPVVILLAVTAATLLFGVAGPVGRGAGRRRRVPGR